MTSVLRRGKLRTKVVAGVLAIVIAALAVFDFIAVSALRQYLIAQTDGNLSSALQQTQLKLTKLLPEYRKASITVDTPVFGQYAIEFVPVQGAPVTLQSGAGSAPLPGPSVSPSGNGIRSISPPWCTTASSGPRSPIPRGPGGRTSRPTWSPSATGRC